MILPDMLKHAPMFNRIDPKQGQFSPGFAASAFYCITFIFMQVAFVCTPRAPSAHMPPAITFPFITANPFAFATRT